MSSPPRGCAGAAGWLAALAALAAGAALAGAGRLPAAEPPREDRPAISPDSALALAEAYKRPGTYPVEAVRYDWFDADRQRPVLAKVYYPRHGSGPFPVIVVSPGLGASREGYEYLGRHWASHGYVAVHVQHAGSDSAALAGKSDPQAAIQQIVQDARIPIGRVLDIYFALDQVAALQGGPGPLQGRLDLKSMAVAGHHFGAWTALFVAGMGVLGQDREETSMPDPRIKAALVMALPLPQQKEARRFTFEQVKVPCLHMAGTREEGGGAGQPAERRLAYARISGVDQYLLTLDAADSQVFAGRWLGLTDAEKDPFYQEHVKAASTAFWDAYLRHDAAARAWLAGGGLAAALGAAGRVEVKLR
ncbi:MAG TPA: hypothetical protein VHQ90_00420 [Thermoanaerobaculia bacterium]|nr:hypothetical protein [Thermoanaerobaculia bacterium]